MNDKLIEYLKRRNVKLSMQVGGLNERKRNKPCTWNKIFEDELTKLNFRKKEVQSILDRSKDLDESINYMNKEIDRMNLLKQERKANTEQSKSKISGVAETESFQRGTE